ncbi:MAG: gamma carbonic anhydrase family protein [Alphaproteobacteria bacterium]|nr:MAG: gamma carbonic anhydrase family protein [Alphaproteobacteria bacterium]
MTASGSRPQGGLFRLGDKVPRLAADAFVAPGACVIGDVAIGAGSSIWFNCVLRGDVQSIRIGNGTNIQDGSVVHVTTDKFATVLGNAVLVGHLALLHGCTVEDGAMVGMNATVMDGCVIEAGAMLAAGSLLTPGKRMKAGELWAGRPAKFVRVLDDAMQAEIREGVDAYRRLAKRYRRELGWASG